MTPPWGINWQRYHADRQDMPHIEKMGYRSFTIYEWMWNNRDFCNELLSVARKDAIFLDRDHPLSEQKDDLWKSDPARKGRDHADQWAQKVKAGQVYTPLDRTFFLGLNEPDSNQFQRVIDAYNEAYCRRMAEHGLRAAAYSFGVGHPSTVGLQPKTPPDWSWYAASAAAILEGHHIAATHEYGAPDGYGWEYWCNRISFCPYPFDVVFDECGIDYGVVDAGNLKGWSEFMDGPAYCRWLDGFQAGMAERAHTRKANVLAYNIFGFDHGSSDEKDWHSFDIRPIRPLLEAFQWTEVKPTQPTVPIPPQPVPPYVPAPSEVLPTPMRGTVTANILNARSGPGTSYPVVEQLAFGDAVTITAQSGGWQRVGDGRWVLGTWIRFGEEPPVQPPPQGDTWSRAWPIVLKIEGGLSTDRNDKGNYRPDGTFVGTRWGISALSHPTVDIINLTKEEALKIYYNNYWLGGGCEGLAWPLALLHFDAYVQNEVAAKKFLAASNGDPDLYMAERIDWYTTASTWDSHGRGWMRRCATMLREVAKA